MADQGLLPTLVSGVRAVMTTIILGGDPANPPADRGRKKRGSHAQLNGIESDTVKVTFYPNTRPGAHVGLQHDDSHLPPPLTAEVCAATDGIVCGALPVLHRTSLFA